jgi:hypothetical protein
MTFTFEPIVLLPDEDHLVLSVKKHEGEPPNLDLGMLTSRLGLDW